MDRYPGPRSDTRKMKNKKKRNNNNSLLLGRPAFRQRLAPPVASGASGVANPTFRVVISSSKDGREVLTRRSFAPAAAAANGTPPEPQRVPPAPSLMSPRLDDDDVLDYETDEHDVRANGPVPGRRESLQSMDSDHDSAVCTSTPPVERSPVDAGSRYQEDFLPAHRGDMILGYRRYDPDYIALPDDATPIPFDSPSDGRVMMDEAGDDLPDYDDDLPDYDDEDDDPNLTNEEEERLLRDEEEEEEEDREERPEAAGGGSTVRRRCVVTAFPSFGDYARREAPPLPWTVPLPDDMMVHSIRLYDIGYVEAGTVLECMEGEEEEEGYERCNGDLKDEKKEEEEDLEVEMHSPPPPSSISPFKAPLPPAKRPPTRPRRSPTSPTRLAAEPSPPPRPPSPHPEDDAISITASVLEELDADNEPFERSRRVDGWLDEASNKCEPPREAAAAPVKALDYNDIYRLLVFDGLCFHHFFRRCVRPKCYRPHVVNVAKYAQKCQTVDRETLKSAYRYALDYELLYRSMYESFLLGFAHHKMQRELLDCLPHLLAICVDARRAVGCLVDQLTATGMSRQRAFESLLLDDNLTKYPELGDILLDLLTEPQDLKANFPLIERITMTTGMPVSVADRILSRVLDRFPCDRELCRRAHDLIIVKATTDVSAIDSSLRTAIATLCKFADPADEDLRVPAVLDVPHANRRCPVLFPDRPIVGLVRPGSRPDGLLHMLMRPVPETTTRTSIRSCDVFALQDAVRSSDGRRFIEAFRRNEAVETVESFAVMVVSNVRNSPDVVDTLEKLLASLGTIEPEYTKDVTLKVVFEVTVMNLLVELDEARRWKEGKLLVERFLDWDGLASSQVFSRPVTHIGRYVLLAKTLALGGSLFYAHEVLQCPELRLTEPSWPWPSDPSDVAGRNVALETIFKNGDPSHFPEVANLFEKVLREPQMRELFGDCFNSVVHSLLKSKRTSSLLTLLPSIETLACAMERNHLRSYLILLSGELTFDQSLRLYEVCCAQGLYTKFEGNEDEIHIRTNMCDQEILTILTSFFSKFARLGCAPSRNLRVRIGLPDLRSTDAYYRSLRDVNTAVKRLLNGKFGVGCSEWSPDMTTVVVPVAELDAFLKR